VSRASTPLRSSPRDDPVYIVSGEVGSMAATSRSSLAARS
jgi:hypothetical protein